MEYYHTNTQFVECYKRFVNLAHAYKMGHTYQVSCMDSHYHYNPSVLEPALELEPVLAEV